MASIYEKLEITGLGLGLLMVVGGLIAGLAQASLAPRFLGPGETFGFVYVTIPGLILLVTVGLAVVVRVVIKAWQ